jgi:DNA-binding MarR family transcriptional regulator
MFHRPEAHEARSALQVTGCADNAAAPSASSKEVPVMAEDPPQAQGTVTDDAELASRLRLAIARIHRQLRQDTNDGLTLTQLSTLVRVEEHEPVRPGHLAALEGISPSTLTRLIATLEEQGLILRETDPADGRVSHLRITDHGRESLATMRSRRTALLLNRLSALPAADRDRLVAALPALEHLGSD